MPFHFEPIQAKIDSLRMHGAIAAAQEQEDYLESLADDMETIEEIEHEHPTDED